MIATTPMAFPLIRSLVSATVLVAVSACASTQINSNTFDIARTYDTLITKQVTFNLLKYTADPDSLPSVVKVSNQTATTTNSLTPNFSLPFTDTIARAATRTITTAGSSVSVAANDQWSQTYTLSPVYDPDQLRRLRSLYQFVVGYRNTDFFEVTYPIIEAAASSSSGSSNTQRTKLTITVDNKPVSVEVGGSSAPVDNNKPIYVRKIFFEKPDGTYEISYDTVTPDLTFIKPPGCILCDYGARLSKEDIIFIRNKSILNNLSRVTKLEKNQSLRQDWLYRANEPVGEDAIALPSDLGTATLYVKGSGGLALFYEFALFTQEASVQGTGSPTSGGQSDGRKTLPAQNINIPVSGSSTIVP